MFDRTADDNGDPTERTPLTESAATRNKDDIINDTLYNDDPDGMTRARRIARYLSQYNWYLPKPPQQPDISNLEGVPSGDIKKPNLDMAWEYFEHIGLPRCFMEKDDKGRHNRAEPGEIDKITMLYPVWSTPLVDMGDFGIGVGLYFTTLQFFAILTFIAGLINIPALISLYSDEYSPEERDSLPTLLLRTSAVCTQMEWRPCPTCNESDWNRFPSITKDRFAVGKASDGSELTFIKISDCKTNNMFGISAYTSLIFVIVGVYVINYLQTLKAKKFDEAEQTSTDYSIKIMNPPSNAKDPDSWRDFFQTSQFHNPTVNIVTIALDNDKLIKALVDRRRSLITLENLLPLGMKMDLDNLNLMADNCNAVPLWKKLLCCAKSPQRLVTDIRQRDDEIVAFADNPEFNVARVFVTFEKETYQRLVMKTLSVASINKKNVAGNLRYGDTVLKVIEPDEPLSIRWTDLSSTVTRQMVQRTITMLILICLIVVGCLIIAWAEMSGPKFTSFIIVVQSYLTPMIVEYLISFETHPDESSVTASRYLKITAFRWFITVIIPYFLTPFGNTLDIHSLIERVEVLFIAELITRPITKAVGIFGIIYRHILGPRSVDQRRMNLMFSGDSYNIGERYTEITKIFFLALFYCTLYPMAFFFASAIFSIYYWLDKFSILRSWKQGPQIGTAVSNMSMFFFKLCTLAYAIMAAYTYSQFPYDNACRADDEDLSAYTTGSFNVTFINNTTEVPIQITTATEGYKYCDQELIRSGVFPPLPTQQRDTGGTWMDESQEKFSYMFGWTAVAVLTIVSASLAYLLYKAFVKPFFFKSYKPCGKAMEIKFGDVHEIAAYVPQVRIPGFAFPFLLCDDTSIENDDVGWNDPKEKGYANHNLIHDVRLLLKGRQEVNCDDSTFDAQIDALFSTVKSYVMDGSIDTTENDDT